MSRYLKKLAEKSRLATAEMDKLGSIQRMVGKGDVIKIFKEAAPKELKTHSKALAKRGISVLKEKSKKAVNAVKDKATSVVKSKLFDAALLALSAAAGPEGPAILAAAEELGFVDALKTLDTSDWTIDARTLKFPIEEGITGPLAGYNKESGRLKLTALAGIGFMPINPYSAIKTVEKKLGVKGSEKLNSAFALMGYVTTVLQNAPTVLLQGMQGHGFHYPGSGYIGPGTDVDHAGPPTSEMDALARTHDIHYSYLESVGRSVYNRFNLADRYMLARVNLDTPEGWAVLIGINAKKVFPKDLTPIPPIPSYHRVAAQTEIPQDKAWLLNKPQRLLTMKEIDNKSNSPLLPTADEKKSINKHDDGDDDGDDDGYSKLLKAAHKRGEKHPAEVLGNANEDPLSHEEVLRHQLKVVATPHKDPKKETARQQYLIGQASHVVKKGK